MDSQKPFKQQTTTSPQLLSHNSARDDMMYVSDQDNNVDMLNTSSQFYSINATIPRMSTTKSPSYSMNVQKKQLKRGPMEGAMGGKHLAEFLPSHNTKRSQNRRSTSRNRYGSSNSQRLIDSQVRQESPPQIERQPSTIVSDNKVILTQQDDEL